MKILKRKKQGLVFTENFDGDINDKIRVTANYSFGSSCIIINSGEVSTPIFKYKNCVIEIENDFTPAAEVDFGGIRIHSGGGDMDFFEYYSEELNSYKRIRLIKEGNRFIGQGYSELYGWVDRGEVFIPGASHAAITVIGDTPYQLDKFSLYLDSRIYIYGVLDGWTAEVDGETYIADGGELVIDSLNSPFNGAVVIKENDTVVCEYTLQDTWGGDEFDCTLDIDLVTPEGVILPMDIEQHLGNLESGHILREYFAVNRSDEQLNVTIRVADYSAFKDWVWLSTEEIDVMTMEDRYRAITFDIGGGEQIPFFLFIKRPDNAIEYDYKNKQCSFFLEVL